MASDYEETMCVIARGGIERCVEFGEDASPDEIYSDCYDAAFDALVDHGVEIKHARDIADQIAREYANP